VRSPFLTEENLQTRPREHVAKGRATHSRPDDERVPERARRILGVRRFHSQSSDSAQF